jgi:pilus assembly protein CpaE
VATSLAWLLSTKESRSTALLDLDVHFGTGALALDLEPGRGLTDAIENPSRIDGLFIERAMVKKSETLAILSAEAPINSPLLTDGAAFYQLQEEMRGAFECTVIDLPRNMLVQHPSLVGDVQLAVLVTELTLAAARDTIRILAWLKNNAPNTITQVVVNRQHGSAGQLEISRKDFENSIERKVDFTVPYDQRLAAQAAKLGKPMAEAGKNSKTVAPMVELATFLASAAEREAPAEKAKAKAKGGSLIGKFDLKSLMGKRDKK